MASTERETKVLRQYLDGAMTWQIVCDDCGRKIHWPRARLIAEAERRRIGSPEELGSRFKCKACSNRGSDGKNVTIRPAWNSR